MGWGEGWGVMIIAIYSYITIPSIYSGMLKQFLDEDKWNIRNWGQVKEYVSLLIRLYKNNGSI